LELQISNCRYLLSGLLDIPYRKLASRTNLGPCFSAQTIPEARNVVKYILLFGNDGKTCNNQLTEEFNDFIRSHSVLFSNYMLHLQNTKYLDLNVAIMVYRDFLFVM
jgi:hypothetical protein